MWSEKKKLPVPKIKQAIAASADTPVIGGNIVPEYIAYSPKIFRGYVGSRTAAVTPYAAGAYSVDTSVRRSAVISYVADAYSVDTSVRERLPSDR